MAKMAKVMVRRLGSGSTFFLARAAAVLRVRSLLKLTAVCATTMERFSTENPRAPGGIADDPSARWLLPTDDDSGGDKSSPFEWFC